MKGLSRLLTMKYGELIFGLLCGCSYFILALRFIFSNTRTGGGLLALFLAPAIIFGIALIFIKLTRNWRDNEQFTSINSFMILNIIILVLAIISLVDYIINGII